MTRWQLALAGLGATLLVGCGTMRDAFVRELAQAGLPAPAADPAVITAADLAPLPAPVERYLRYMGVVGRPRDGSFRLHARGRFRMKPEEAAWFDVEVWQHNQRQELARFFRMEGRMSGLPVVARDTYREGHGHMLGKVFDLITVADGQGMEFDTGELVTYLNDAILTAPSMVLGPETTWTGVDARTFDVALTDRGRTVTARVTLDEQGAPADFGTTDRYVEDPADPAHPLIRTEWHTPVQGWTRLNGRALATRGQAAWHLQQGIFVYADFVTDPTEIVFNVAP